MRERERERERGTVRRAAGLGNHNSAASYPHENSGLAYSMGGKEGGSPMPNIVGGASPGPLYAPKYGTVGTQPSYGGRPSTKFGTSVRPHPAGWQGRDSPGYVVQPPSRVKSVPEHVSA